LYDALPVAVVTFTPGETTIAELADGLLGKGEPFPEAGEQR
jgi:hypothetical protein